MRNPSQFVVDDLPETEHRHRIGARLSSDGDAHNQFVINKGSIRGTHEFRLDRSIRRYDERRYQ